MELLGLGACEGYSLEIGETFRCSVVLKPGNGPGEPPFPIPPPWRESR